MFKHNLKECNIDHFPGKPCPQLPGTVLRIFIPAGAVINLANIIEVSSPSGICLIIRLPFIGSSPNIHSLLDAVRQAGGTVEFSKHK